ncbi:hypothetical protein [Paraburkholderia sp. GAS348]|uniref:hypothetical protein n=1 Tax=Paraburkholderia sp. GAS348 TaxID=3035132 RepID=UPI003D243DCB
MRLVIYFHELWVTTAPINSSAFWLAPLQKKICQESASLADYGFFNTEWAYRWGKTQLGERAIYSPVFSNVGEPEACPVWDSKSTSVVVFGSGRTRDAIYAAASDMLCMHLRTGTIGQVIDVGAPTDRTSTLASEYGVSAFRACGSLPAHDISLLLASTKFGLFNTPWGLASKSGVFAAYVAHGVAPVSIFDDPGKYSDPTGYPMPDIHFLPKLKFRSSEGELDRLGRTVAASASLDYEPSRRLSAKLIDLLP